MQKINTGDLVVVTTGQYKGKTAKVIRVDEKGIYLEWLNIRKKAKKWTGYVDVHHPIDRSNVQFRDGDQASRIGIKRDDDGKKVRFIKKSGAIVG